MISTSGRQSQGCYGWRLCAVRVIAFGVLAMAVGGAPANAQRVTHPFVVAEQTPLWLRTETTDTTFVDPNQVLLAGGRVYLTDPKGPAVVALDARSGATLWRYSKKGRGPGELEFPGMVFSDPRGIIVFDLGNRRLNLFSPEGALLEEMPVPGGFFLNSLCATDEKSFILNAAVMAGPSLFSGSFGSSRTTGLKFPFVTDGSSPLETALVLAPVPHRPGTCVAARRSDDGLALMTRAGAGPVVPFVERVVQRPFKPPQQMTDTTDLPIPFAKRVWATADEVLVWFGGRTCHGRCIDIYSLPDLKYEHSIEMAGSTGLAVIDVGIADDVIVMLGSRNGSPAVAAFAWPDGGTAR